MNNDDFSEPAGAGNFLQRYHQMRAASTPSTSTTTTSTATKPSVTSTTSTPTTPVQTKQDPPAPPSPSSPRSKPLAIGSSRTEAAKNVWGSVFHPLGRSPKSADRYDLGRGQQTPPGLSASELHAKGSGISLDDRQID